LKAFEYIACNNISEGEEWEKGLSVAECYQLISLANTVSVNGILDV
jgi:hypothetical protein